MLTWEDGGAGEEVYINPDLVSVVVPLYLRIGGSDEIKTSVQVGSRRLWLDCEPEEFMRKIGWLG